MYIRSQLKARDRRGFHIRMTLAKVEGSHNATGASFRAGRLARRSSLQSHRRGNGDEYPRGSAFQQERQSPSPSQSHPLSAHVTHSNTARAHALGSAAVMGGACACAICCCNRFQSARLWWPDSSALLLYERRLRTRIAYATRYTA